jgi:hypothetical protein
MNCYLLVLNESWLGLWTECTIKTEKEGEFDLKHVSRLVISRKILCIVVE